MLPTKKAKMTTAIASGYCRRCLRESGRLLVRMSTKAAKKKGARSKGNARALKARAPESQ